MYNDIHLQLTYAHKNISKMSQNDTASVDSGPSGLQDPLTQSELVLISLSVVCAITVLIIHVKRQIMLHKPLLQPSITFRVAAQIVLMLRITIEVGSSIDAAICFPYLRLSDNLGLTGDLFARCFYFYRASLCIEKGKRDRFRKIGLGVIIALYIKSIMLLNIIGYDTIDASGCDFVYPFALPVYIAAENWFFDFCIVLYTSYSLWKGVITQQHTKNIIRCICIANLTVLVSFIVLVSAAMTYGIIDQNELIIVIFNLVYVTSIWIPDIAMMIIYRGRLNHVQIPATDGAGLVTDKVDASNFTKDQSTIKSLEITVEPSEKVSA
jgi:hypothetical protein